MITLFHCMSARSLRPLWTLEEIGTPYELKMLPFPPRVFAKDYLAINPLGTIPLMIDGDTRMTESAAICQYLAVRHGNTPLNVSPDEPGFGAFLNFLHFGEATLTFPQTLVLRYRHFEPPERRQPTVADDYAKWFLARLRTLDQRLTDNDYLAAGRFTVADISVGYALKLGETLGLHTRYSAPVTDYWKRLSAREGYLRAMAAQEAAARAQGVPIKEPLRD